MNILNWKQEMSNVHAMCHFAMGILAFYFTHRFWPVLVVGIGWELFDWLNARYDLGIRFLDSRGFSILDVIWVILGGAFCLAVIGI